MNVNMIDISTFYSCEAFISNLPGRRLDGHRRRLSNNRTMSNRQKIREEEG